MAQQLWPSTFPALRQRVNGHPLFSRQRRGRPSVHRRCLMRSSDYYSTDTRSFTSAHAGEPRGGSALGGAQAVARFVNAADPSGSYSFAGRTEGLNLVASTWGATHLRP